MLKKKPIVFHPPLIAIFPIIHLFLYNIEEVSLKVLPIPIVITLIFTFLLRLSLTFVLRDRIKAGLCVSLFLLFFFSYGHIYKSVLGLTVGNFIIGRHIHLLPLFSLIFIFLLSVVIKRKSSPRLFDLNSVLNIASFFTLMFQIIAIIGYLPKSAPNSINNKLDDDKIVGNSAILEYKVRPPDIYYIILDSYSSNIALGDAYNYDNREFTDYLSKKGFYIASKSRSNYQETRLSLSSSLNMEYVNNLFEGVNTESLTFQVSQIIPLEKIVNSNVMKFLKSKGYNIIQYGPWSKFSSPNYATARKKMRYALLNQFNLLLLEGSILKPIVDLISEGLVAPAYRDKILYIFDKISEVPGTETPSLIFAHILCPHPPFIFDQNGEEIHLTEKLKNRINFNDSLYINQLRFINKKITRLVDDILSKSSIQPIIIIQGDHGSGYVYNPNLYRTEAPDEKSLKAQMNILNAYYLPGNGKTFLYDTITPVNTFRLIFNLYFNTHYDMLKDESYFFNYKRPYKFINVTDKAKYN